MKFANITEEDIPARPGGDKAEADEVIAALQAGPVAVDVGDVPDRNVRIRIAKAAQRAGVTITSWYDADSHRVIVKQVDRPSARVPRKAKAVA